MPRETHYFEEAYDEFCRHNDATVSRVAMALYREMLKQSQESRHAPMPCFNIHFFIGTVIRLLRGAEVIPPEKSKGSVLGRIQAINIPSSRLSPPAAAYIKIVKAASTADGDPFDVEYALRVVREAGFIDDSRISLSNSCDYDEEFDDASWLSGFVSPEAEE